MGGREGRPLGGARPAAALRRLGTPRRSSRPPADPGERSYRRASALLSAAVGLLALSWAFVMPYLHGPDEVAHHNSVARVVAGGGWPLPYEADRLPGTQRALLEAGVVENPVATEIGERSSLLADGEPGGRDAMVQHPPVHYLVTAAVIEALGGADLRWDVAHMVMRSVSAAMLALAVPFVVGFARHVTGSRLAALLAGSAMAGVPFLSTMGGYVTNDALLGLSVAATLYLVARTAVLPVVPAWLPGAAGLAYGVALLSKGYALLLAPVLVVLALAGLARGHRLSARAVAQRVLLPGLLAAITGGWWWVRNLVELGVVQPSQSGDRERQVQADERHDVATFVESVAARLSATFWGRGSRAELAFPEALTTTATVVALVALVVGLVAARRRGMLLAACAYPVLILVTLISNAHAIYWDTADPHRGIQGRYLFQALPGALAAVGITGALVLDALGRLRRRFGAAAMLLVPVLTSVGALAWSAVRARRMVDRAIPAVDVQTSTGLPVAVLLAVATVLLALAACLAVVRSASLHDEDLRAVLGPHEPRHTRLAGRAGRHPAPATSPVSTPERAGADGPRHTLRPALLAAPRPDATP